MRISDLTTATVAAVGDRFPAFSAADNDTRNVLGSQIIALVQENLVFPSVALTAQYAAPNATGFSVVVAAAQSILILTPTAGFAAGTIVLPTAAAGQMVQVTTTQAVTALTVSGGTVNGAPTTLAANGFFTLRYDTVFGTWFRVG